MSTAALSPDDDASIQRPLLERILLEIANRLAAVGLLLLIGGLGAAYTSKDPAGGGSKVLAISLVPTLIALVASLWINARRRQRGERALVGVTIFNLVLMTLIVVALIADQLGYIAQLSASIKGTLETADEVGPRRRPPRRP